MSDADVGNLAEDDGESGQGGQPGEVLSLQLVAQRLTLSATKLVLNWRLQLHNVSEIHIVGLRIWSDMTSARRSRVSADDAGRVDMRRAHLHKSALIAPGGEAECSGEWQMPRDEAHLVKHGAVHDVSKPRVLPLGRFRMIGAGIEPLYVSFAIGTSATDETMPEPLLFDDRMQIFANLATYKLS